jgi:hypothetical protein
MLFDHFAEGSLLFIGKGVDGTEDERADEVGEVGLVENVLEVGEDDPFGFVEFDCDHFFALAVEVVETIRVDDFVLS